MDTVRFRRFTPATQLLLMHDFGRWYIYDVLTGTGTTLAEIATLLNIPLDFVTNEFNAYRNPQCRRQFQKWELAEGMKGHSGAYVAYARIVTRTGEEQKFATLEMRDMVIDVLEVYLDVPSGCATPAYKNAWGERLRAIATSGVVTADMQIPSVDRCTDRTYHV